jgi:hypothetical protein
VPTPFTEWKATRTSERASASARTTRRGRRPWHVGALLVREPGDLALDRSATAAGPHRKARSRSRRAQEASLRHSSLEADEQSVRPRRSWWKRAGAEGNASQCRRIRFPASAALARSDRHGNRQSSPGCAAVDEASVPLNSRCAQHQQMSLSFCVPDCPGHPSRTSLVL